jgi:methylmalonyl-CoA mutase
MVSNFPPVSKSEWLNQIAKDLKGRPMEELLWTRPDGMQVTPFVHADDFAEPPAALAAEPNAWEICEEIKVSDPVSANRQALDALEGGAEGLCFVLDAPLDATGFAQLLDGIYLDYIGLHFAGKAVDANPGIFLAQLETLAAQKGLATTALRGSLAYDPVPVSSVVDWRYLAELIEFCRDKFPQFKLIRVSSGADTPLKETLHHSNTYLSNLSEKGLSVSEIARVMEFSIPIGKSYFVEIARLRALKLLWLNALQAWNAPLELPAISVQYQPETYTEELYSNMIRATTMAMSAILGGASRLTVLPYDAGRESQAKYPATFSRRIARNVQHLLKMESALDTVTDPAAGSYYIETLTRQLAKDAWETTGR